MMLLAAAVQEVMEAVLLWRRPSPDRSPNQSRRCGGVLKVARATMRAHILQLDELGLPVLDLALGDAEGAEIALDLTEQLATKALERPLDAHGSPNSSFGLEVSSAWPFELHI